MRASHKSPHHLTKEGVLARALRLSERRLFKKWCASKVWQVRLKKDRPWGDQSPMSGALGV